MEVNFTNNKGLIDLNFLKDIYLNGRLKGANVFAKLFQIDDNSPFKKEDFNINLFNNFEIGLDDWLSLMIFLKTGIIPYQEGEREEKILNNIMIISIKLGGIPSLDLYYQEFYHEKRKKKKKKYNPQNPEEDYKKLFLWKIAKDSQFNIFQNNNPDYQATKIFRVVISSVTEYVYFRKLKKDI
jgi:hypothetical protein